VAHDGQTHRERSEGTRDQIAGLFESLELVEPGVVYVPLWRPETDDDLLLDQPDRSANYGVARKR